MLGPLAADGLADAERIVDALPPGSRLTLKPLDPHDRSPFPAARPAAGRLAALERRAAERRLVVTEWSCRAGLAEVGRGFFDVDRITRQPDLGRRALDLVTCAGCPSRTQCHGELDLAAFERGLARGLGVLGLTAAAPPLRTGPRSFALQVAEPSSRGDETYLSHAVGQPVSIALAAGEPGPGGDGDAGAAVLRRWWSQGFLPVNELNAAAERVLDDLRRRLGPRTPDALRARPSAEPDPGERP